MLLEKSPEIAPIAPPQSSKWAKPVVLLKFTMTKVTFTTSHHWWGPQKDGTVTQLHQAKLLFNAGKISLLPKLKWPTKAIAKRGTQLHSKKMKPKPKAFTFSLKRGEKEERDKKVQFQSLITKTAQTPHLKRTTSYLLTNSLNFGCIAAKFDLYWREMISGLV